MDDFLFYCRRVQHMLMLCLVAVSLAACASTPTSVDVPSEPAPAAKSQADEVIVHALSLMGARYKFGGNSVEEGGFDCSGFVRHVFANTAGVALPRSSGEQAQRGKAVDLADLAPGDLVFYNTRRAKFSHVGIYIGDQRFIHAPSRGKKVEIVAMAEPYWRARFNGARRILATPQRATDVALKDSELTDIDPIATIIRSQ
jgi:cell wall-associated NlpC family hydrolase